MKEDNNPQFKEVMGFEASSFRKEHLLKLVILKDKPQEKSLTPFTRSFKREKNPMGKLIKHKTRLCACRGKQIKGVDCWIIYAPTIQATTIMLMSIHRQTSYWKSLRLDYVLALAQAPTNAGTRLKIPSVFHAEDDNSNDAPDQ